MSEPRVPILSTREIDPEATRVIDAFVIQLAEEIDRLQDAQVEDDLACVSELAHGLARRADEAGYAPLVKVCGTLIRACTDQKPEDAEAALVEMTEISLCIRLGHRGAA